MGKSEITSLGLWGEMGHVDVPCSCTRGGCYAIDVGRVVGGWLGKFKVPWLMKKQLLRFN